HTRSERFRASWKYSRMLSPISIYGFEGRTGHTLENSFPGKQPASRAEGRFKVLPDGKLMHSLFVRRRARFLSHIVTEQRILITQIKPTARDHGMAEGGETAPVRLPEAAFLLVAVGDGFDQRDLAALAAHVKMAVRHD